MANSNNGNRESIEERLNKQDAVLVKVLEDMKQSLRNTSYYAESGYLPKADCSKQECSVPGPLSAFFFTSHLSPAVPEPVLPTVISLQS